MNFQKTPLGNNSAKHPTYGMTWKRAMKIERIARLSVDPAGYTNDQIGNMLGVTPQTVVLIRQLPEYHAKAIELLSGVTSKRMGLRNSPRLRSHARRDEINGS